MVPGTLAIVLPGKSSGPRMLDWSRWTVCDDVTVAVNWAISTTPSSHP